MEKEAQQAKFDGWAIVEVMGHQRYVGYVTTEAYGQAVLFRVDVPALPARERVMERPGYAGEKYCPAGTKVEEGETQGYSKLIGSGSIYCITPCDEAAAMRAVEQMQTRPLMAIKLPEAKALPAGESDIPAGMSTFKCCGQTPEAGHAPGCRFYRGDAEDAEGAEVEY